MKSKFVFSTLLALVFAALPLLAQQPTSRVIPFNNVTTNLDPSTPAQALTIQLWDVPAGGAAPLFVESQTLDVDASRNISFTFGSATVGGLNPDHFPSGASRYLDVVNADGVSVLAARLPLMATSFALSPGPTGAKGDKGDKGDPGTPGGVQTVVAGDGSITVAGTATDPTVAVANGGITTAKLAAGSVTSAQLAPNAITHNATLSGDGTGGAPLSVANPLEIDSSLGAEFLGIIVGNNSSNGTGVFGQSISGNGVVGNSPNGMGVVGGSSNNVGVYGGSNVGIGVEGSTLAAHTLTMSGVYGLSSGDGGIGVIGEANIGNAWGVNGKGNAAGVVGQSANGTGVWGITTSGFAGRFDGQVQVNGTTSTRILQITGGADLAERFEVRGANQVVGRAAVKAIEPGMVVVIDAQNAGELIVSSAPYDHRVAGVISGAGGVHTGMLMGQSGSLADGNQPVALAGRVYCWADTKNGPIVPGDLLTTSNTPGHAMKVTNYRKAQGAIIGKAMTGLKENKGLVLVLVSLQ